MLAKIEQLLQEVKGLTAQNPEELEALRIKYLSKKGAINALMADFRNVPAEQKKEVGMKLNELKNLAQERIAALKETFENQDNSAAELDLTRTAYPIKLGTRHPLTIVRNEIIDIFGRMGFTIADGPEVEDDWHVFSSMNFPEDHPARDMQDTFFIETHPDIILRTHTSSVQSRVMEVSQPPIRVICPGRVYRNEAISYRAHCFFHQVEGLYVDKNVSFTDLKQVLLQFAQEMFGPDTKIRLRPSYFPFTEPSAEMDIRSRQDVNEFITALNNSNSSALSNATSGYHYHLVEAASEERLDLIEEQLKKAGFLAPLQPWEQNTKQEGNEE